jgi:hypothetical protein
MSDFGDDQTEDGEITDRPSLYCENVSLDLKNLKVIGSDMKIEQTMKWLNKRNNDDMIPVNALRLNPDDSFRGKWSICIVLSVTPNKNTGAKTQTFRAGSTAAKTSNVSPWVRMIRLGCFNSPSGKNVITILMTSRTTEDKLFCYETQNRDNGIYRK